MAHLDMTHRPVRKYLHRHPWDKTLYPSSSNGRVVLARFNTRCLAIFAAHWEIPERTYPHATYTRDIPTSPLRISPSKDSLPIRWSSISNPHLPNTLPPGAHPIRISLKAGETLYLPAGWWHHVRQGEDANYEKEILEETTLKETDKTIAINWWYDIEGRGMGWVWLRFLRGEEVPDGN